MSVQSEITRISGAKDDIADAIIEKGGTLESGAKLDAMAAGVRSIPTGIGMGVIADDYSSSSTYSAGDYCIYDGALYRCKTDISSTEEWTSAHWEEVTVCEELQNKYEKPSSGIPASDLAADAKMVILSYGQSTWSDFEDAYTTNRVVYCRASSGSDPSSGSQTRMAFMAYVNNQASPTEVEFQYYRSVNSHSDSQQGDQVFVYKLTKSSGWSVTTRNAFTKIDVGTGLTKAYNNGTLTITNSVGVPNVVSKTADGLAPQLPDELTTSKFLRQDGTWAEPNDDKVSKSGDTMTGALTISGANIWTQSTNVIDGTAASAVGSGLRSSDFNGNVIGYIRPYFYADGKQTMEIASRRKVGGSDSEAYIRIGEDASGTEFVEVSEPSAWRSAIEVPTAYTSNPEMDGTASAGSSTSWARGDHVHPHDSLIVRQNLLDNWYFVYGKVINNDYSNNGTFPINQRGQRTYTSPGGTYTIDRWCSYNTNSIMIDEDGLTFVTGNQGFNFAQIVDCPERVAGKTVTASLLFASVNGTAGVRLNIGGTVYQGTDISQGGLVKVTRSVPSGTTAVSVLLRCTASTTVKLVAAKLEIGDTQTLAHLENGVWVLNEVPNYNEQLARCQRYLFYGRSFEYLRAARISTGQIDFALFSPVPMAKTNTADFTIGGTLPAITEFGSTTQVTGFTYSVANLGMGSNYFRLRAEKANHGLTDATLYPNSSFYISCEPTSS